MIFGRFGVFWGGLGVLEWFGVFPRTRFGPGSFRGNVPL